MDKELHDFLAVNIGAISRFRFETPATPVAASAPSRGAFRNLLNGLLAPPSTSSGQGVPGRGEEIVPEKIEAPEEAAPRVAPALLVLASVQPPPVVTAQFNSPPAPLAHAPEVKAATAPGDPKSAGLPPGVVVETNRGSLPAHFELAFAARLTETVTRPPKSEAPLPRIPQVIQPVAQTADSGEPPLQQGEPRAPQAAAEPEPKRAAAAAAAGAAGTPLATAAPAEREERTQPLGEAAAAFPRSTPRAPERSVQKAAESEPAPRTEAPEIAPPPRAPYAREISLRLPAPDKPGVDVQLVERAGRVHVAVRTPDAALAATLRDNLGSLVQNLERTGYHTETWAEPAHTGNASSRYDPSSADSRWSNEGFGNHHQGHHGGHDQHRRQPRPEWLAELEKTR